ncbi:PREDICTED: C-type lectin domain family 3 member A homolog [Branchiostoma belcheri]|uniref:C-type lectin domain family 3 member A homolog n=1 Tax=Branchiostoma belcheri TaxID=7741 RepID=A0A6P4ZMT5_BRABE|nr:PREDICTED: C-type lectin domain family 3 member A homolog [Branchiostoma belcheri]
MSGGQQQSQAGDTRGATPKRQDQTDWRSLADATANIPNPMYVSRADGAYPGGVSGRRGVCSFLRARRSCPAVGIAVLLGLVAVGLAPLTFSNKQEISQLSTTMKRDMHQLATTVNALKCDQGDMCKLFAAVDALKLDLDNERNRSATLEQRLKDDMSTAVDALKRDLDNERNRSATLEQRLLKIEKIFCPEGYTKLREICYKAFKTRKTFSDAAATCRADGGTLAMPRDARTNAFLSTLYNSVRDDRRFWFGLHDQREEGRFEWVDGSALGPYSSWAPGEPNNLGCCDDCVIYSARKKDKWNDEECNEMFRFICQAAPERP